MADFSKYLRPGESVTRSAGISRTFIVSQAVILAAAIFGSWLIIHIFGGGNYSPIATALKPLVDLLSLLMTVFFSVVGLILIVVISVRAAFVRYAISDSRVLRRSFLRVQGAELSHVQDVVIVTSLLGKLLGFGDVIVKTAGEGGNVRLNNVDAPAEWFRDVHEAVRQNQMAASRIG